MEAAVNGDTLECRFWEKREGWEERKIILTVN